MPGDPEEDEFWHKPVWETEDEESLDPPALLFGRARKTAAVHWIAHDGVA